jgi:flagellar protein FlgJ
MSIAAIADPVTSPATAVTAPAPVSADEKKLRKSASDLEGMFVAQLYKAMRDTVPQGEGIVSGGSGEEIFTGLMDEHVAADTPKHWNGGISEALYRQLRQGLPAGQNAISTSSSPQAIQTSDPLAR